jgi:hypothetical protein
MGVDLNTELAPQCLGECQHGAKLGAAFPDLRLGAATPAVFRFHTATLYRIAVVRGRSVTVK